MTTLNLLLMMSVVLGNAFSANPADSDRQEEPETKVTIDLGPERSAQFCGVQAVCILSRLYDRPILFEKALAEIPVTEKGSSLDSLRQCLDRNLASPRFEAVRAGPELLKEVHSPLIAHFEPECSIHAEGVGHYVIVLAAGGGEVLYLDPSTLGIATEDVGDFTNRWSGFALVPSTSQDRTGFNIFGLGKRVLFSLIVGLCAGAIAMAIWSIARRPSRQVPVP